MLPETGMIVPPERTQSLPASSCESSTEPMDTDDARQATEEIYHRIRQHAGLSRSGSVGDVTLQPEPLGVMTQGRLVLRRRTSEQPQVWTVPKYRSNSVYTSSYKRHRTVQYEGSLLR